jgi:hypothetical protein
MGVGDRNRFYQDIEEAVVLDLPGFAPFAAAFQKDIVDTSTARSCSPLQFMPNQILCRIGKH